ncbi:MAG TPA: hypothetical protein VMZ53_10735 [Kofleriaceae bacterium]|nr:hypothetical protein [Kofleriaceae bacterium]
MVLRIVVFLALASAPAFAQHHHGMESHSEEPRDVFGAGVAFVAASFETMDYVGNYEGVLPSVRWSRPRFGAGVTAGFYRLEKNGADYYDVGDLMVNGQATLVGDSHASAGVTAAVMTPIGAGAHGTSMGHVMLMPALFGAYQVDRFDVVATAGYSRAIGGHTDHDHGPWPLVEPMLMSELSWSAGGDLRATNDVRVGGRVSGGIPVGDAGSTRVVGALRIGWHSGRVDTTAEVQAGLVGDPFKVRGVVSTALSF